MSSTTTDSCLDIDEWIKITYFVENTLFFVLLGLIFICVLKSVCKLGKKFSNSLKMISVFIFLLML